MSPTAAQGGRQARWTFASPKATAQVSLDERQAEALRLARTVGALLVVGAPGTGKTTLVQALAVAALRQWAIPADRLLVLAASRPAANALRDRIAVRAGRTMTAPAARTPASVAVAVLRARAHALGEPAPTLISGPEQDRVLAEILRGHSLGEGSPLAVPTWLDPEVLGRRGFRNELRDLFMRAAERGLSPSELSALGEQTKRPEWVLAGQLFGEYREIMRLSTQTPDLGERFDPATVIDEAAAALLAWSQEVPEMPAPGFDLVLVDDYQEATAATARLLSVLQDQGSRLVLVGNPDEAVQTFRGAAPTLIGRAEHPRGAGELGAFGAVSLTLATAWRQPPELVEVTERVSARIGLVGGPNHRGVCPGPQPSPRSGAVTVAVLTSRAQEAAWIARELRAEHLLNGTPWQQMAVISRSTGSLRQLSRELALAGVPVAETTAIALRDEPAVAPLLTVLRLAAQPAGDPVGVSETVELLTSPYGEMDALALRHLRRALRATELSHGGGRTSDALLTELLARDQEPEDESLGPFGSAPVVIRRMLSAARRALERSGATAQTVLWAIWAASEASERWRRAALIGGAAGVRADRHLDAIMALFRAADLFVQRHAGAGPRAFAEFLATQDLPTDSLAATAHTAQVAAHTPQGAAGKEWEVVVVAGVQEGIWPDLRLRDSLLGSHALTELLAGRADRPSERGPEVKAQARTAVHADELRAFNVATSRARRHLLISATSNPQDRPSPFLDLVDGGKGAEARHRTVGAPFDLRGLVAETRVALLAADPGSEAAQVAARLLAELAEAGMPEADPANWYGVGASTSTTPLWTQQQRVPLSPSKVESVLTCPVRWLFETAGGTTPSGAAQNLGNLIHRIAEDFPRGSLAQLQAALDRYWPQLALSPGWPASQLRAEAEGMVVRLAQFIAASPEPLAVEVPFEVDLGNARLRGRMDRVDKVGDRRALITDFKTGKTVPSVAETAQNPQLGCYQLALDAGGAPGVPAETVSVGAQLVFLRAGKRGPTTRSQPALDPEAEPNWAEVAVADAAEAMAASTFAARENPLCRHCRLRRACPLLAEGRMVV